MEGFTISGAKQQLEADASTGRGEAKTSVNQDFFDTLIKDINEVVEILK